jgi:hypothetical protein
MTLDIDLFKLNLTPIVSLLGFEKEYHLRKKFEVILFTNQILHLFGYIKTDKITISTTPTLPACFSETCSSSLEAATFASVASFEKDLK